MCGTHSDYQTDLGALNFLSYSTVTFWSWLFPITYVIHIAEEYWGGEGYSAYLLSARGVHFSPTRFLVIQAAAVVLMVIGILLARRFSFPTLMIVILGSTVLVNALTHILSGIGEGGYGPGLASSVLIWLPLGVATLVQFKNSMTINRYWTGVAIGMGINLIVAVITMRGGQL